MQREFVEKEVDPQALAFNRAEKFNVDLFRKLGTLGLLGITVDPEFGGSGMDATAAVIAHGLTISFLPLVVKTFKTINMYYCRGIGSFRPCFLLVFLSPLNALC